MIGDKENIHLVEQFIKNHKLAVISTVASDDKPQSAVVGFAELDDLVLIFGTSIQTRKYHNLKNNPLVSLVIGWEEGRTVQYEGQAEEITDEAEKSKIREIFLQKTPTAIKFISSADEALFRVTPSWVRYSDLSKTPFDILEINF